MYGAIWRIIPGPFWAKVTTVFLVVALVTLVLFQWGFPAVSEWLGIQEQTVSE